MDEYPNYIKLIKYLKNTPTEILICHIYLIIHVYLGYLLYVSNNH